MRLPLAVSACLLFVVAAPADDHFEKHVRPLLAEKCVGCHGPDKQKGGLRLDTKTGWKTGGDSGAAVTPGKPDDSPLMKAVRGQGGLKQMPPDKKLSDAEVAALAKWIADGAADPRDGGPAKLGGMTVADAKTWWAFQPVARPPVPGSKFQVPSANPVDAFIQQRLEKAGLTLSKPADKRTLLRRVTFDLTGLPPTPEEVDAFLKDDTATAYETVVERLLSSPHYGERWGRHWLDLVRYADTAGETSDHPVPHAWRYRNWVIDAFNRDLPYDEFLREQLAGDLIAAKGPPDQYASRVVATGFLATARRFDFDITKSMHLTHEDGIDTIGKALLGLTIGCARCHDHKYDAISARDYYALYGILDSTRFPFPGCEHTQQPRDMVPLVSPTEWAQSVKPYQDKLAKLDARLSGDVALAGGPTAVRGRVEKAELLKTAPKQDVAYAVAEGKAADAKLHLRGDPEKPGEVVPRRWLEVLGGTPLKDKSASGRLELAGWIASKDNPLTARVMVNRLWLHHFGKGLVATPNDFGTRGEKPTHPQLLDWLAAEFVKSGWSVKALHRTILHSTTYRQSGDARPDAAKADPANDFYWRFDRRRLSAEELRDSLLAVSGQLDRKPGEAHPIPPESSWSFTQHVPFGTFYDIDKRSVYLIQVRNRRHPFLGLFDGADPNATTPQRQTTTVPTQALYFLNDPFFHAQAAKVAEGVRAKPDTERVNELFRRALQRPPTDKDREFADAFLVRYRKALDGKPDADTAAWNALTRVLLASNEFLFVE